MSADSFLSSSVEAAVGMAGFAGIVAAIRHRDIATWPRAEQLLLRMLLIASAMACAFALLPAVLTEAEIREPLKWRVASGALLTWQAAITWHRSRQFRAEGGPSPVPRLLWAWVAAILIVQAANLVLAVSWLYLLGVFGVLVNAFSFFLVLLVGRAGGSRGTA